MKQHVKKKQQRRQWQQKAKEGLIVKADGTWERRGSGGNSMQRDFYPQRP